MIRCYIFDVNIESSPFFLTGFELRKPIYFYRNKKRVLLKTKLMKLEDTQFGLWYWRKESIADTKLHFSSFERVSICANIL